MPELHEYRLEFWSDWSDFIRANPTVPEDPCAIVVVKGGSNYKKIEIAGMFVLDDGENHGELSADYIVYRGRYNLGEIWGRQDVYSVNGMMRTFVGPDKTPYKPVYELSFEEAVELYKSKL